MSTPSHEQERRRGFANAFRTTGEIYGKEITNALLAAYWEDLNDLPVEAIKGALKAHRRDPDRGRFFPKPADILHAISAAKKHDGRPGPDEAWAIAVPLMDESETAVWTDEVAKAWGVAAIIYQDGDRIGARKTFQEVYQREVELARMRNDPPKWRVSAGTDPARRIQAVELAASMGRLTNQQANKYLPGPNQLPDPNQKALPGNVSRHPSIDEHKRRENLRHVRELMALVGGKRTTAVDLPSREELKRRQAEVSERIAEITAEAK